MKDEVLALFREVADLAPAARSAHYDARQVPQTLRVEVESLLRFDTNSESLTGDFVDAVRDIFQGQAEFPEKTLVGPYRVVRKLGQGGMGAVYLAERVDGEVEQRVAIKVVSSAAALPAFQQRFLSERRILASLNHPGIARLLDAGHTTDGHAYLVMEHIDGASIDEYCAQLDFRIILKLFLCVCEAVSYAHRNLVIHRDLKPSNILVDASGAPKLLDFGIAKILDGTDTGQTLIRILTPDYASPEQLRGEAHSTATDIYSLGAVLRKLLAGNDPGIRDAGVPKDIDFIVRRATSEEPEERYATVDAFADDIRAFLQNRPVRARGGNAWYRGRKFLRRYWVPVTAAAVAGISLSAGLFLANRERIIAQHRLAQVRQLANKVFDIDAAIRNTPGTTKARQLIVSTSLEYLRNVGAEIHGDKDLALDISSAYVQLAHIQGVPVNSNLGQFQQASESLRAADALVESILKSAPADRRALLTSATIAHDRMVLAGVQNHRPESLTLALDAAAKMDRFDASARLTPNDVREVAFMYSNVAVTFVDNHRFDDAIRYARRSIAVAQRIEGSGGQQSLAYGILAEALRESGDLDEALKAIRSSRTIQERLADDGQTWRRANLILALWREGSILAEDDDISLDRPQDALPLLRRALDLVTDLASKDADDVIHHHMSGEVARRVGDLLRTSDPHLALAAYDQGLRLIRQAKTVNEAMRRTEATLLARSAYALRLLHRNDESWQRIDAALRLLKDTGDYPATAIEPASEADLTVRALADHYAGVGQTSKAVEIYLELLAKLNASKSDLKGDLRNTTYLSNAYAALARMFRKDGRIQEAARYDSERTALWQSWRQKLPANAFVQRQLASLQ